MGLIACGGNDAERVACCLLWLARRDGIDVSPKKLQKLLYYVQGWSLAIRDKPAFSETMKAWKHGPVVPEVWHKYKAHKWRPIPTDDVTCDLSSEDIEFIDSVWTSYREYDSDALERMVHEEEPPFMDVYKPDEKKHCKAPIPTESIARFFKSKVSERLTPEMLDELTERESPPASWYREPLPFAE